jgi:hypothetical protein
LLTAPSVGWRRRDTSRAVASAVAWATSMSTVV